MVRQDTLPSTSALWAYRRKQDFIDCYSIGFDNDWARDHASMVMLASLCVKIDAPWLANLMRMRDFFVRPLGLKTSDQAPRAAQPTNTKTIGDYIGFFRIYAISENEIILGEDDVHQDFRLTIFRKREHPSTLYVSTCCQRHNWFGHLYLATILPIHKLATKSLLQAAANKLIAAGNAMPKELESDNS